MKKTIICCLLFTLAVSGMSAMELAETWEIFSSYAAPAADNGFPVIDLVVIKQKKLKHPLFEMDRNQDQTVTIEECFTYYKQPGDVADWIRDLDHKYRGEHRHLYSAILKNLDKIQSNLDSWDQSLQLMETVMQYRGIKFTADPALLDFLEGGLFKLPAYLQYSFFSVYQNLLKRDFDYRYNRLCSTLASLHNDDQLDAATAGIVSADLQLINNVESHFSFADCLGLYVSLNDCIFNTGKTGGSSTIREIREVIRDMDKYLDTMSEFLEKRTLESLGNWLIPLLADTDNSSLPAGRKLISADWEVLINFLEGEREGAGELIVKHLKILFSDTEVYLLIRKELDVYLKGFFPLQYETRIGVPRIYRLFLALIRTYAGIDVKSMGRAFRAVPSFVQGNPDRVVYQTIDLCYAKTGQGFSYSIKYMLQKIEIPSLGLETVTRVYRQLASDDLLQLASDRVPLEEFHEIMELYHDTLAFHLPLFVQTYVATGEKAGSLLTFRDSSFFHTQLSVPELENLRELWQDLFAGNFLFLLETAVDFPVAMSPLSADRREQLFRLFRVAAGAGARYTSLLLFNLEVHGEQALRPESVTLFDNLFQYADTDVEAAAVYASHYVEILKTLVLEYAVTGYETHAFLLMDIAMANGYSRAAVADYFGQQTNFLADPVNLETIREISAAAEYSPDIFLALGATGLSLQTDHSDQISAFLSDTRSLDNINRELFGYGLQEVDKLFRVQPVFSQNILFIIHDLLAALQPEKRQTLLASLGGITLFKETITSPAALQAAIPVLRKISGFESDLFAVFFQDTLPACNHLTATADDLEAVFYQLQAANLDLINTGGYLSEYDVRVQYFSRIFTGYAEWITGSNEIIPVHKSLLQPFTVWQGDPVFLMEWIRNPISSWLKSNPAHELPGFFNAITYLLALSHDQMETVNSLDDLNSDFFCRNDITSLISYLESVEKKQIAVDGGKIGYFESLKWQHKWAINNLINLSCIKKWRPWLRIGADVVYQVENTGWLAGSSVGLTLPLFKSWLNSFYPAVYLDLQYLTDLNLVTHEFNGCAGMLLTLARLGLSRAVDFNIFANLGVGTGLDISLSGTYRRHSVLRLGLQNNFDILQKVRISLKAEYMLAAGDTGAEERIAWGLILVLLPD